MKASEKKTLLKHIKKDDMEFRGQIKDDIKLKKKIIKSKTEMPKEKKHEAKESKSCQILSPKGESL